MPKIMFVCPKITFVCPKITFVCCPKPFSNTFSDIQENAILSWNRLPIEKDILVCGNEFGVKEFVENHSDIVTHIPTIKCTDMGTPLVSDIFEIVQEKCEKSDIICYINADIILFEDFVKTIEKFTQIFNPQDPFLLIGQRWDWNNESKLRVQDFSDMNDFKNMTKSTAKPHGQSGIDYFVFSNGTFPFVYPFALGKFTWDQWLVGNAYRRNILTVDVGKSVYALHQNGPWFMHNTLIDNNSVNKIKESVEFELNKSFERYVKDIEDGTRWYSEYSNSIEQYNKVIYFKQK